MREWNPKAVWDDLCDRVKGWMGGEEDNVEDPGLLLHLALTAPLLIGLIVMLRRA